MQFISREICCALSSHDDVTQASAHDMHKGFYKYDAVIVSEISTSSVQRILRSGIRLMQESGRLSLLILDPEFQLKSVVCLALEGCPN